MYWTCATSFVFHFDRWYLVTDVSYGDRKGVIIFLNCASSFMLCEQFFPGKHFILTIFTL